MKVTPYYAHSSICRFSDERRSWRVAVETWPDQDGYRGRLVFTQDRVRAEPDCRVGPDALHGRTREDVLGEALALPEQRLRQLWRSLA